MIDTNVKASIINQKKKDSCLLFFHPKNDQDNIETPIKNKIKNLTETNGGKHQGFKDLSNILSYELELYLTQLGQRANLSNWKRKQQKYSNSM